MNFVKNRAEQRASQAKFGVQNTVGFARFLDNFSLVLSYYLW
jgi:hypothetical protein